jgi:hypothetical protein
MKIKKTKQFPHVKKVLFDCTKLFISRPSPVTEKNFFTKKRQPENKNKNISACKESTDLILEAI